MDWIDDPPTPPAPPMPSSPLLGSAHTCQLARERRHQSWDLLLPQLFTPFAMYRQASHGQRPTPIPNLLQHDCTASCVHVITCSCMPVTVLLVRNGVFPTSPSQCRTAVSIDFLDVYRALFERSCDAITALAAALHTVYDRRGFCVISTRNPGELAKEPFRDGLAQAVQWYSNLRTGVQAKVDAVLVAAEQSILPPTPPVPPGPTPGRAHRILRDRCPACFGLETWGWPLSDGGDVQLGGDGCFSYRHLKTAGDGPISYDPSYFISKEKIEIVRTRIMKARSRKPRQVKPLIPQETIDACQASWDAANDNMDPRPRQWHDASGVFVLTCRHSQVLFLCDIDTPGERQEFIVALMEEVNSYLPPQATIVQAYDVGCVTDHSLDLFPILSKGFRERVCFVINAMHSFGHQWVCQLVYSPRLRRGLCLTDAEGVERFWSCIRKLIGITRNQWNSRRIWMIDQYAAFVNKEGLNSLGGWIHRQEHKNLAKKRRAANKVLADCGVSVAELRRNWEEQKAAQTSLRSHAPVRLRRELNKVLSLQAQIDTVEQSITDVKNTIKGPDASSDSITLLHSLKGTHETLNTQAEALYASLNIHQSFPELQNLPLDFVQTLLMMRDLKINIRKRAIGSFYEWENLDRAVGGRREALGTKLHQATRKAISKRQPALLRSIAKFNGYCADLERLRPPGCKIPVPSPLSTQMSGLRDDPSLHEDVWITPSEGQIPRWLNDSDVRDGIRALHSADRCAEEAARLNIERQNMATWLKQELLIVAAAINTVTGMYFPENCLFVVFFILLACVDSDLTLELQLRFESLEYLQLSWASAIRTCPQPLPHAEEDLFEEDPTRELTSGASDTMVASEELDPGSLSDIDHDDVLSVQDMLANPEAEEESTGVEADIKRIVLGLDGRPRIEIEPDDISRIQSSNGRLNGLTINALAAAFLNLLGYPTSPHAESANKCAIFSTYDLPRIRYKASDDALWGFVNHTKYWEKALWLIPIHRVDEEHWVLAVVDVGHQQIFFFDSLAVRARGWRQDIRDIMILITRMVVLANRHKHPLHVSTEEETWIARPLFTGEPRQSNGHDCGLWVLCVMAAILRGYTNTGVSEAQMPYVRQLFSDRVFTMPRG
ncbi:hypothetical protein FB451DRAFT_1129761 [Mycena latifolia]|nr:hypothetical protein FB451DRAFT_1129761 [Mycena latifolia]